LGDGDDRVTTRAGHLAALPSPCSRKIAKTLPVAKTFAGYHR
jgi:hypothetical protein